MADKVKHFLTFEGDVPADIGEQAMVHAHPKVIEAKKAMIDAFKEAGHPHTVSTKIVRPKKAPPAQPVMTPAEPRHPRVAAE